MLRCCSVMLQCRGICSVAVGTLLVRSSYSMAMVKPSQFQPHNRDIVAEHGYYACRTSTLFRSNSIVPEPLFRLRVSGGRLRAAFASGSITGKAATQHRRMETCMFVEVEEDPSIHIYDGRIYNVVHKQLLQYVRSFRQKVSGGRQYQDIDGNKDYTVESKYFAGI